MKLLTDSQMQAFIINGFVTVKADFSPAFHESVRTQAEAIFSTEGNPGNDILPKIPDLADLSTHPAVTGALTSVLGPGYAMHPHRHCHLTPPQQPAQRHHQDSYEDDQNVRHHRTRWAMAFYYPQNVNPQMGPTSVLPASQYYTSRNQAERKDEALLCGDAGTVTIVHYDLWHRATTNRSDRNRFMIKFLFCRMAEPTAPSWNCSSHKWRDPAAGDKLSQLWKSVWNWHLGNQVPHGSQDGANCTATPSAETRGRVQGEDDRLLESDLLENVYRLAKEGENGTAALMAALAEEAESLLDCNLAASHTNPSQLISSFGLSAQGAAAVPVLTNALTDERWPLRAAAADILGDIGLPSRHAVPCLLNSLEDQSEWVRRNTTEALGNIALPEAVPRLARLLTDDNSQVVRHNAALSLAKIGPDAESARAAMTKSLENESIYVRGNARLALARIGET